MDESTRDQSAEMLQPHITREDVSRDHPLGPIKKQYLCDELYQSASPGLQEVIRTLLKNITTAALAGVGFIYRH